MGTLDRKGPRREREPIRKQSIPSQEYSQRDALANGREALKALCPSWEPDFLREVVQGVCAMAGPGAPNSACAFLPEAGVFQIHFVGNGGVMIDPISDFAPAPVELAQVLKIVLGDKLTVGRPAEVSE